MIDTLFEKFKKSLKMLLVITGRFFYKKTEFGCDTLIINFNKKSYKAQKFNISLMHFYYLRDIRFAVTFIY